ncbi:hypothetical protein ACFLQR_04600, partial [Verrucomicrobiota bacterium]
EEDPESWERLFTDPVYRCHIVQLAGFMKEAARLVTEFSMIDLYWFYRSRGTQYSPRVVVLDEVQNMDHREESPLAQLLREGRKFGFSLILATQIMSNLDKDEKDRLQRCTQAVFQAGRHRNEDIRRDRRDEHQRKGRCLDQETRRAQERRVLFAGTQPERGNR